MLPLLYCDFWHCSDVESHDSLTADEDDDNDADADVDGTDADIETEDQSSDDDDGGDIDELLDEALDEDMEDNPVHVNSKTSITKEDAASAAPAQPVSYISNLLAPCLNIFT